MADGSMQELAYDVWAIREDFPILSKEIYGKPLVYLDNGASAQKPKAVIDCINSVYSDNYANVHRGLHYLSNTATDLYEQAREKARRFLNAGGIDEIVFTRSSTEAINLVAQGFLGPQVREDDEIVLTIMEHHSNIIPWHFHREHKGAKLVWVPVDDDGELSLEAFEASLSSRTKMVAITHVSNVLGTVVPIKKVCEIAHARGIPVLVDGSQGAVHLPVDVRELDCDFYIFTGHKVYGPTGIGVLYGKAERLAETQPYQGGGEMIVDVSLDGVTYADPPHRFEAGTPPIAQAIGLGAALDYMDEVGRAKILDHEAALTAYAHEQLSLINSLKIFGNAKDKSAIVSFELEDIHAHDISMIIDREGIAVRAGTHCAQPLLQRFGVTSTCRASFGLYNSFEEVDRLVAALRKAQQFFS